MKSLKPSHRENKRYLMIRGVNPSKNIEIAILDYVGNLGLGQTGLEFIKSGKDFSIIAINREALNIVRASICIWKDKLEVTKVSGTIKGLNLK